MTTEHKELVEKIRKCGFCGITDKDCGNLSTVSAEEIISLCRQHLEAEIREDFWAGCEFVGLPPDEYDSWQDFLKSKIKRGVAITTLRAKDES